MEEGPEPQAWVERAAEEHHHGHGAAEIIQEESRHELHKHHRFALGVAAFQVGVVLASVSLLVRFKGLYALSLVAGAAGLVALVLGHLA